MLDCKVWYIRENQRSYVREIFNLNSLRSLNITGDFSCWWCCLKRMYSKFLHRYRYPSRSAKYQTLQNIPNVREIVPTSVFLLRRNFYLYARLQNFLKAESINIYIAKSQPFAKIVRTYTRKHANLEYDCSRNFPPVRSSELLICM